MGIILYFLLVSSEQFNTNIIKRKIDSGAILQFLYFENGELDPYVQTKKGFHKLNIYLKIITLYFLINYSAPRGLLEISTQNKE